jgi:hypothetical protein
MTDIQSQSPPPRKRRKARQKAKAKAVLHAAFAGWQSDTPEALAKRVNDLRHITVYRHRFSEPEWVELDRMRRKMLANEKFTQATREKRHV